MIYPTFSDLTNDKLNRYQLALATAKCARIITDEYVKQREAAEKAVIGGKESDKAILNMVDKELKDEKAVKIAINRIHDGKYKIVEHVTDIKEEVEAQADGHAEEQSDSDNSSETTETADAE